MNMGIALGGGKAFGISAVTVITIMVIIFFIGYM